METEIIKKKRGRKPKNREIVEINNLNKTFEQVNVADKKKRGRKKKYEIENFNKIINRDLFSNFNHSIAYSDDEEYTQVNNSITVPSSLNTHTESKQVKNILFGNLNITVSKKINDSNINNSTTIRTNIDVEKENNLVHTKRRTTIVENEYSDEEKEIPIEEILNLNQDNFEKYYKNNKKYLSNFTENNKEQHLKRLRVITTLKNVIKDSVWPEKTDVCCWWCCHKFNNSPCTLPIKYDEYKKKYDFVGIFCSWNCTKSYNLHKKDHKMYERAQLITLIVKQLYGIESAISIKSAPYRECLKMFGGYMTIEEFRNEFSIVDAYKLNLTNFNYIYPEITEVTNVNVKKTNNNLRLTRIKN